MTFAETGVRAVSAADDASVIVGSQRDPEQFGVIFDRYFAEIHRYAERRLGTEAADEIAADTFLVAFDKRRRFRPEHGSARPWLYGIATNLIGKHRRCRTSAIRAYERAGSAGKAPPRTRPASTRRGVTPWTT